MSNINLSVFKNKYWHDKLPISSVCPKLKACFVFIPKIVFLKWEVTWKLCNYPCTNTRFPFNSNFFCSNTVIVATNTGGNNWTIWTMIHCTQIVTSCYGDLIHFKWKVSIYTENESKAWSLSNGFGYWGKKSGQIVLGQNFKSPKSKLSSETQWVYLDRIG